MNSITPQLDNSFQTQGTAAEQKFKNPFAQEAKQNLSEIMAFQLWVSQQATTLSKLKVFHTMAKSVNDQQ